MMQFTLTPGKLTFSDIRQLLDESTTITLDSNCIANIQASEKTIQKVIDNGKTVYGINTGFGALANTKINNAELETLQRSIVLSHAAGTGKLMDNTIIRLMLALKINSLARGYSGVKLETIQALITLFNEKVYPCIPEKGSVGASGDLAPLAHLSAALLGVGNVHYQGKLVTADKALALINLKPLQLAAKEGLALLNGTQASTTLAITALLKAETLFVTALLTGALSVDAARGSVTPFDARIHTVRGHATQIKVAEYYREILKGSEILESHQDCDKVQDPYSLRCQPQVMGACLKQLMYASEILLTEANAVSDNPLIFSDDGDILSGGNFHAEPVALAADALAVCIAEIGAISERRIALLVDPHFSGLPAFLVKNPGINSGFMIAQVTAAALASENKSLAHPASVDSLPTSANQEDHVSMATFAARRLHDMNDNTASILAIELLAGCQGIDFLRPLKTSPQLETIFKATRQKIPYYDVDRYFAPDIEAAKAIVLSDKISDLAGISIL